MTHSYLPLILVGLATVGASARLTRLIVEDTITAPVRQRLDDRAALRDQGDGTARDAPAMWRFLAAVTRCHWCSSIYVSAGTGAGYLMWATSTPLWAWSLANWFVWFVLFLALSHVVATMDDTITTVLDHLHNRSL